MILPRLLQAAGIAGLLGCAHLAWQATPWGGEGWARGRLLYAAAGAIPAPALLGIAGLAATLRRQEARLAEMEALLKDALRQRRG